MSPIWDNVATEVYNKANPYSTAQEPQAVTHDTIQIDTQTVPANSTNFLTLDKFNSVEYDATHLWDLKISGAPAPFDKWFPAQNVEEVTKGPSVSSQSFGIEEINMLNSYGAISMRVEIIDNDVAVLERWLKHWQKSISIDPTTKRSYVGFRYLDDILATMTVIKYNWQKEQISRTEYFVLPTGSINLNRTNDANLKVLTVNFASFGQQELS